jgi:hypothetical protein
MTVNIASKEMLARLLAQENVNVIHDNVDTASFNVKTRVLTLPLWDDMEDFTYDHLVGHEVGHALYTPCEELGAVVAENGDAFKSYLNVVEDARIEKLTQRRYPGLRRSFVKSYQKMMTDKFFGGDIDVINNYDLIDRLNVLFKCGQSVGVDISTEEQVWVKALENLETFDDAKRVALELFAAAKQKQEQEQEQEEMDQAADKFEEYDMDSDGNDQNEDSDDESEESEDMGSTAADEDLDNDDAGDSEAMSVGTEGGDWDGSNEPMSVTDKILEKSIRDELSSVQSDIIIKNIKIDIDNFDFRTVSWKEIASDFKSYDIESTQYTKFMANNKKSINYLVKEFEMKKRASEYARTTTSKSGVIDTVKMNNYKFSDDIFSRINVVPEGKNHGLLMFVDWSGSMFDGFDKTIEQLLCIVMFCRQVNIPFRVYGFSDRIVADSNGPRFSQKQLGCVGTERNFGLLELFHSDMNRMQFKNACSIALRLGGANSGNWRAGDIPSKYYLGGTPLNTTVVAAIKIHKEFQKTCRLDIVNSIFLTDGESSGLKQVVSHWNGYSAETVTTGWYRQKNYMIFNKKRYAVGRDESITDILMEIYRDATGANLVGIRIMPYRCSHYDFNSATGNRMVWADYTELKKKFRKEKWMSIDRKGYSKSFLILNKNMGTANGQFAVADDASTRKIKTAFSKSMTGKLQSRKMLTEFIDMIA